MGLAAAPVSESCVMAAVSPTPEEPRPVVDTASSHPKPYTLARQGSRTRLRVVRGGGGEPDARGTAPVGGDGQLTS